MKINLLVMIKFLGWQSQHHSVLKLILLSFFLCLPNFIFVFNSDSINFQNYDTFANLEGNLPGPVSSDTFPSSYENVDEFIVDSQNFLIVNESVNSLPLIPNHPATSISYNISEINITKNACQNSDFSEPYDSELWSVSNNGSSNEINISQPQSDLEFSLSGNDSSSDYYIFTQEIEDFSDTQGWINSTNTSSPNYSFTCDSEKVSSKYFASAYIETEIVTWMNYSFTNPYNYQPYNSSVGFTYSYHSNNNTDWITLKLFLVDSHNSTFLLWNRSTMDPGEIFDVFFKNELISDCSNYFSESGNYSLCFQFVHTINGSFVNSYCDLNQVDFVLQYNSEIISPNNTIKISFSPTLENIIDIDLLSVNFMLNATNTSFWENWSISASLNGVDCYSLIPSEYTYGNWLLLQNNSIDSSTFLEESLNFTLKLEYLGTDSFIIFKNQSLSIWLDNLAIITTYNSDLSDDFVLCYSNQIEAIEDLDQNPILSPIQEFDSRITSFGERDFFFFNDSLSLSLVCDTSIIEIYIAGILTIEYISQQDFLGLLLYFQYDLSINLVDSILSLIMRNELPWVDLLNLDLYYDEIAQDKLYNLLGQDILGSNEIGLIISYLTYLKSVDSANLQSLGQLLNQIYSNDFHLPNSNAINYTNLSITAKNNSLGYFMNISTKIKEMYFSNLTYIQNLNLNEISVDLYALSSEIYSLEQNSAGGDLPVGFVSIFGQEFNFIDWDLQQSILNNINSLSYSIETPEYQFLPLEWFKFSNSTVWKFPLMCPAIFYQDIINPSDLNSLTLQSVRVEMLKALSAFNYLFLTLNEFQILFNIQELFLSNLAGIIAESSTINDESFPEVTVSWVSEDFSEIHPVDTIGKLNLSSLYFSFSAENSVNSSDSVIIGVKCSIPQYNEYQRWTKTPMYYLNLSGSVDSDGIFLNVSSLLPNPDLLQLFLSTNLSVFNYYSDCVLDLNIYANGLLTHHLITLDPSNSRYFHSTPYDLGLENRFYFDNYSNSTVDLELTTYYQSRVFMSQDAEYFVYWRHNQESISLPFIYGLSGYDVSVSCRMSSSLALSDYFFESSELGNLEFGNNLITISNLKVISEGSQTNQISLIVSIDNGISNQILPVVIKLSILGEVPYYSPPIHPLVYVLLVVGILTFIGFGVLIWKKYPYIKQKLEERREFQETLRKKIE